MALSPSAELVAVASRDIERCKTWVHENACKPFDTVTCHGTYDALLDNPHVDAVYIPLPTTMHAEWVAKAAAKGKHVLVEKPVGVNLAEVTSMVDACMKHRRLFMDGEC
jgi:predicted dehydrogenase